MEKHNLLLYYIVITKSQVKSMLCHFPKSNSHSCFEPFKFNYSTVQKSSPTPRFFLSLYLLNHLTLKYESFKHENNS